jgi:hypothetical protein
LARQEWNYSGAAAFRTGDSRFETTAYIPELGFARLAVFGFMLKLLFAKESLLASTEHKLSRANNAFQNLVSKIHGVRAAFPQP